MSDIGCKKIHIFNNEYMCQYLLFITKCSSLYCYNKESVCATIINFYSSLCYIKESICVSYMLPLLIFIRLFVRNSLFSMYMYELHWYIRFRSSGSVLLTAWILHYDLSLNLKVEDIVLQGQMG